MAWTMSSEDVHFIEDLEERENASPLGVTTQALEEEGGSGPITMACYETGCW
jgi:hypothetical protein